VEEIVILTPSMHESNYQSAIKNKLDEALAQTGLQAKGFHTLLEEGRTDIQLNELAKVRFILEIKKTRQEVSRAKWWSRTRAKAADFGVEYFGISNGERLILFRDRRGAKVGDCIVKSGIISFGDYGPNGEADVVLDRLKKRIANIFMQLFVEKKDFDYEKSLNTLLEKYRTSHQALVPQLKKELNSLLKKSQPHKRSFIDWARSFSNTPESPNNITIAAEECGHVVLNRIIFYEILRNELNTLEDELKQERDIPRISLPPMQSLATKPMKELFLELGRLYKRILRVDYDQVFSTDNVLDMIPLNYYALALIQEFIEDLEGFSLTRDQFGEPAQLFSQMFEKLIPIEKRHDYGQVFTEKKLVDVLCNLCVRNRNDVVLDPACGTGSFLEAAYDRIWLLSQRESLHLSHPELLKHLHGVEISKFPIHLCAMRLALKDTTYVSNVDLKETDFFKLETADVKDRIDVILCNPPYLRHEVISLTEKRYIRLKISRFLKPLRRGKYPYSPGRADKYFYFVEYSTAFLKTGGLAGWVLSDKFLVNISGRDLKRFLLDHYRIKAMIKFGRRSFPDFMVDNCLVVLEKLKPEEHISDHQTVFLKVKQEMSTENIESEISNQRESSNEIRRIVVKRQKDLDPKQRWTDFFIDTSILGKLRTTKGVASLPSVCSSIKRGRDDGCSEFFYPFKYLEDFDIDNFLVDGLKSSRKIETLILKSEDCEKLLLIPPNVNLKAAANDSLRRFVQFANTDSFDPDYRDRTTKKYVKVPEKTTVSNNSRRSGRPWYSFDPGSNDYDIVIPRMVRTYFKVLLTEAKPYLSTNFWGIKLKDESNDNKDLDRYLISAFLNSSLGELQFEDIGRKYVGLIKMEKPDIFELVVIDPKLVSNEDKLEIKGMFRQLSEKFKTEEYNTIREQLDKKFLTVLGLSEIYDDLMDTLEEMKSARRKSLLT